MTDSDLIARITAAAERTPIDPRWKEIKQLISDVLEAVKPEREPGESAFEAGSESSTPRHYRRAGHNVAIDELEHNIKKLGL